MATDRDTYVHRHGITPETASIISSKNRIYATAADAGNDQQRQIGVVATFDPNEARSVEPVRGIGYGDHVAELVPGVTDPMTLAVTRTAQYLSQVYQVFGYKGGVDGLVRSLRHHKWPFDIVQEIIISSFINPAVTGNLTVPAFGAVDSDTVTGQTLKAIMTYFEGCWISDYSASYAADAALVQENVTVNVTDIISAIDASYVEGSPDLFNIEAKSKIMKIAGVA